MATIALSAVTAYQIDLVFGHSAGESGNKLAQVSDSPDFESSDTYLVGPLFGNFSFGCLQPGRVYFFRAKDTVLANAQWSTPLAVVTSNVTEVTAYSGFSIAPAVVVIPDPIVSLAYYTGTGNPAYPATNLLNDDPMSLCRMYGAAACTYDFETSGRPIDFVSFLGANAADNWNWYIQCYSSAANRTAGTTLYSSGAVHPPPLNDRRFVHLIHELPAPQTGRFWRIQIDIPGVTGTQIQGQVRHLVVGSKISSVNISRGAGQVFQDLGQVRRNRFGTPDRTRGWRMRQVDFEISWLKEAEYMAKWDAVGRKVGTVDPILVIPNSKNNAYRNDRLAYGCITSSRDENVQSNRYTKAIAMDSLY